RFTTEAEIDEAVRVLREQVARLRELSPLWDMYRDGIDLNSIQWSAH
ncbi:MAG: cysteine desulfurase IscS, partial [Pseudomonadota bacterium]